MAFQVGDQVVSKITGLKRTVIAVSELFGPDDTVQQIVKIGSVAGWFNADRFELAPQKPKFKVRVAVWGSVSAHVEDGTPLLFAYDGGPLSDQQKVAALRAGMASLGYEELI